MTDHNTVGANMDEDLNDLAAMNELFNTGETPRETTFDKEGDVTMGMYEERFIEAFESDEVDSVNVSTDGRELTVETERFTAHGQIDEMADTLRVMAASIERDVKDEPYLLLELEDDAQMLAEYGDARQQFDEWRRAEPMGAAALTVGERNNFGGI